ncbi:MAG: hypothetical protein HKO76_06130 [Acidimicrobiia bacterium]|nr:hypothetical protein [Acidimicrobiia bacterium]
MPKRYDIYAVECPPRPSYYRRRSARDLMEEAYRAEIREVVREELDDRELRQARRAGYATGCAVAAVLLLLDSLDD